VATDRVPNITGINLPISGLYPKIRKKYFNTKVKIKCGPILTSIFLSIVSLREIFGSAIHRDTNSSNHRSSKFKLYNLTNIDIKIIRNPYI